MLRQDWIGRQIAAGVTDKGALASGLNRYRQEHGFFLDDPKNPQVMLLAQARQNPSAYVSHFMSAPAKDESEMRGNIRNAIQIESGKVLADADYEAVKISKYGTADEKEILSQWQTKQAEQTYRPSEIDSPVKRAFWGFEAYMSNYVQSMMSSAGLGETKAGDWMKRYNQKAVEERDKYARASWIEAPYEIAEDIGIAAVKTVYGALASAFQIKGGFEEIVVQGGITGQSVASLTGEEFKSAVEEIEQIQTAYKQERIGYNPSLARELFSVVSRSGADLFVNLMAMKTITGSAPWRTQKVVSKFGKLGETVALKAGASSTEALKYGVMAERLWQASHYGAVRAALTHGTFDERVKTGLVTFAYMATPAFSGWWEDKFSTVVFDFALNTGISYATQYKDILGSDMTAREKFLAIVPSLVSDGFFSARTTTLLRDRMSPEMVKLFAEIEKSGSQADIKQTADERVQMKFRDSVANAKTPDELREVLSTAFSADQARIEKREASRTDDLKELTDTELVRFAGLEVTTKGTVPDDMMAELYTRFPTGEQRESVLRQMASDIYQGRQLEAAVMVQNERIEAAGEQMRTAGERLDKAIESYRIRLIKKPPKTIDKKVNDYLKKVPSADPAGTRASFARDYARERIRQVFGTPDEPSVLSNLIHKGDTAGVYGILKEQKIPSESTIGRDIHAAAGAIRVANKSARDAEARLEAIYGAGIRVTEPVKEAPQEATAVEQAPVEQTARVEPDARVEAAQSEAYKLKNSFYQALKPLFDGWTPEERLAVIQWYGYKQDYPGARPPDVMPKDAERFMTEWKRVSNDIAEKLVDLEPFLNIGFTAIRDNYFPMLHDFDRDIPAEFKTVTDMISESRGIAEHRRGTFDGVKKDLEYQMETYLTDAANLIAAGERIRAMSDKMEPVIDALIKEKAEQAKQGDTATKEDIREALPEEVRQTLSEWDAHKQFEADLQDGRVKGIADQWESIAGYAQMSKEVGVGEIKKLFSNLAKSDILNDKIKAVVEEFGDRWIDMIDPFPAMMTADGGKIGANVRLWDSVLKNNADAMKEVRSAIEGLSALTKSFVKDGAFVGAKQANELLGDAMFKNPEKRKIILSARTADDIHTKIEVSASAADYLYRVAQMLKKQWQMISLESDQSIMQTDLQKMEGTRRKRFFELESKIATGAATPEERSEYLSYAPAMSPESQNATIRKVVRNVFERTAIDQADFFSYFESTANRASRAMYMAPMIRQAKVWADYMDKTGHKDIADMWRTKIEHNMIGNMWRLESAILAETAKKIKELGGKWVEKKTQGGKTVSDFSALNMLKSSTPEDVILRISDACDILQRARITRFLVGNIGWSLTTQWQSLHLTVKHAGVQNTLKAVVGELGREALKPLSKVLQAETVEEAQRMMDVLTGSIVPDESTVVTIKQGGKRDVGAIEAAGSGQFEEAKVSNTMRGTLRNSLSMLASWMENYTTRVSYIAGATVAAQKGFTGDDARLYGDYIAAFTQTMYDRVSRNSLLNSRILRAAQPMQSFVLTQMSNVLDTLGVVGYTRSRAERMTEAVRWMASAKMTEILLSMAFGDDFEDAVFDPSYEKFTIGSAIPYFGQDVDIFMNNITPWRDSTSWQRGSAQEKYLADVGRVLTAYAKDQPNADAVLRKHLINYYLPFTGFGGIQMVQNFLDLQRAEIRRETKDKELYGMGRFEGVSGARTGVFVNPDSIPAWTAGLIFGRKAVDETSKAKKERLND